MTGDPHRRSGVYAVDHANRAWCPALHRDVHVERCLDCGRLSGLLERDGGLYVSCSSDGVERGTPAERSRTRAPWR